MKKFLQVCTLCIIYEVLSFSSVSAAIQTCTIGTTNDASNTIQVCINSAQTNDIIELPIGKYFVAHQIKIEKPITIRTQGTSDTAPRCSNRINNCAELIASPDFDGFPGILQIYQNDTTVDHLIINGNKEGRGGSPSVANCISGSNGWGFNMRAHVANFKFTNSINKNALCGTGLETSGSNNMILNNLFIANGNHNSYLLWADGLTVHDCINCIFERNDFVDNTDVDFILGGCQQCSIKNNTLRHTDIYANSTFAGLMIHAWPSTSGNYTGTIVSNNTIDCGQKKRCGFAMLLGAHAWYPTMSYGGSFHDNTITNGRVGLVIDDFSNAEIYNNLTTGSLIYNYTMGSGSHDIDQLKDNISTVYTRADWDGTIPNYSCSNDCGILRSNAAFLRQSIPAQMIAGQTYPITISMKNTGFIEWTKSYGFALLRSNNESWGISKVYVDDNETVPYIDDTNKDFSFSVTAPTIPGTYNLQWRMNQDGYGSFGESSPLTSVTVITQSLAGDINNDNKVDIFDYNILVSNFGNPYTIFDYNTLVANFGKSI